MQRRYAFCLLLACATVAHAQWNPLTAVNTTVRADAGVDAVTPLMSPGPQGSTYVSWFENTPTGYQLRMQRLEASGYLLWDVEGLVVSDHPQNSALYRYDLTTDNEGNAIVAFQDERSGALRPVVYKLDPLGNFLWGADGIELPDGQNGSGLSPVIGVLADNSVVVAWNGDGGYIPFRILSADGTLSPTIGMIAGVEDWTRPKVIARSDGGFFVQCVRQTGSFPFTNTLFAFRYTALGVQDLSVQVSTRTTSFFYFPQPVSDGHDGFYLAFNTGNPGNPSLTDVYLQRLRANGTPWSADGTELMTGTATQRFGGALVRLSDDDGLMLPIQVTNTAQSAGAIHVQRVDTAGLALLGASAVDVVPSSTDLPAPYGIVAAQSGAVIAYGGGPFGNMYLRAAGVHLDGSALYTAAPVSSAMSNKDDAALTVREGSLFVSVWADDRLASGIYAQALNADGSPVIIDGIAPHSDTDARLRVLQDATGNWLQVLNATTGAAELRIHDAAGRLECAQPTRVNGRSATIRLPELGGGVHVLELVCGGTILRTRYAAW